jgi:hypothetical protein
MIRKTIIALAATTALAIAALPSTASAKKWGHHGHGWRVGVGVGVGLGLIGAGVAASCYRYEWVATRYGMRQVLVNYCGY